MTTAPSDTAIESAAERSSFPLVLGLDTFGDGPHDENDLPISHAQTIRNLVEQGVLADQLGVDFFGIGEHHTDDWPMSAADVVLSAIAARTSRIRLGSAVTVLSSDDPVRVFQRFSTLNAVSGRLRDRSGFTRPGTWRRLMSRPSRNSGRGGSRPSGESARSAGFEFLHGR